MKSMPITTNPPGGKWAEGGKTHMLGFEGAGTQVPGQTGKEAGANGGRREQTAKGGPAGVASSDYGNKKHGSNKYYAGTQEPGTSGPTMKGGDSKFAAGGKTSMFGNRGSQRAKPGCSAPD